MKKYLAWVSETEPVSGFAVKAIEKSEDFTIVYCKTPEDCYRLFDNAEPDAKIYVAFGTGTFAVANHLMNAVAPIERYALYSKDENENYMINKLLSLAGYRRLRIWKELLW